MTQKHEQYQSALLTPSLRALRRAIARVPGGRRLDNEARDGRRWDAATGLYLRPRDGRAAA